MARAGRVALAFAACIVAILTLGRLAQAADPDALWKIVHNQCVPDQQEHGMPKPCARVELGQGIEKGFAVLKDLSGATHFLLIPTAPVAGIESPEILAPDATNYFAQAWRARALVEKLAPGPLPRDAIGLAVNSVYGRTQNQLHIHMDCIRPDVRDALRQDQGSISVKWTPFDIPLAGHHYLAIRVQGDGLEAANPFTLLAAGIPGARDKMGSQTLVAIGATFADGSPGFYLLDDHADLVAGDRASGEQLLDRDCAIARP